MSRATLAAQPWTVRESAPRLPGSWWMLGLILPMLIYATRAVSILADPDIPFDTLHTYLPLARAFLEDPAAYFDLPSSVTVAPGAVLYMALWGADPAAIKSANLFFALLSLVLASDAARRIAGSAAAAAAAWAFALSQMLLSTGVTLMGEAPFVFLVVAWIWACAYASQDAAPSSARRNAAVVFGGLCLAGATLTRGTWLYWLPAASLAGLVAALLVRREARAIWLRLALVHVLALTLVGGFMARQYTTFDRPLIATGAGAALYFGSNPILHGYEPPFFGLAHDEATVTDHEGHLSLEGDRRLSAVTRVALPQTPLPVLAGMCVQKLGAILFFSRAHLNKQVFNERATRVALLVLAVAALWLGRRRPVVWLLAGALGYQCAVHIPVMYNPRYSASALDPVLTLLAASGVGFVALHPSRIRRRWFAALGLTVLMGIALGVWHHRSSAPVMPDISLGPHRLLQSALPADLSFEGSADDPFKAPARLADGALEVVWQPSALRLSATALLDIEVPYLQGRCKELWLVYTAPDGASRAALVRLNGWQAPQHIAWGMNAVRLPDLRGSLHLKFVCEPGTAIQLGRMGLFDVSLGRHYRAQALGSALAQPLIPEGP